MPQENSTEKDDIEKLKQEIAELKEKLNEITEAVREKGSLIGSHHKILIDVGERIGDYVAEVMEDVAEGIAGELEKSVFIGPHGIRVLKHRRKIRPNRKEETKMDFSKAAAVMSALGSEHRLKILQELIRGGKYVSELQEKLTEISASTLSSHLDVLEKAGLVVQEKVRGRYLITIPGRMAYRMARRIAKICKEGVEISVD